MPKRYRTKISREEFNNSTVPSNYVIVELLREEDQAMSKSGVYMGMHEDDTWEDERETHSADIASVVGRVAKLPSKLTFGDKDNELPWETEVELQIDDLVWFNLIETKNANEITVDGMIYRCIPYRDCYVAKREYWRDKWKGEKYTKIIMLNGFVLLEQVKIPRLSDFDLLDHGVYEDRGIVKYFGTPNKSYVNPNYVDALDIKEGDLVYFQRGYKPFPLERRKYFSMFEGDKLFWCVQRRRLTFAIDDKTTKT